MSSTLPGDAALIVVDVQNDFCPSGALGVPDGDQVFPVLNALIADFRAAGRPVVLTADWHPEGHCSFAARGGPWPPHCIQGTAGAAFHPTLETAGTTVFRKGADPDTEAYSGFAGQSEQGCDLAGWLRDRGVRHLWVGGLATDYCVKATVLDGLREGFAVTVIRDGCRAVEVQSGDGERALAEMRATGAEIRSDWLAANLDGEFAHVESSEVFDGVPVAEAGRSVAAVPYTIWQLLQHMIWWQDWWLGRLEGRRPPLPASLAETWAPTAAPADARALDTSVAHFAAGIARARELARGELTARVPAEPGGIVGAELVQLATHNSYHAGEVVLLRRLLGVWHRP